MKKLFISFVISFLFFGAMAQRNSITNRARAAAAGGEQLESIKAEIADLLKSNNEQSYLDAANAYMAIGDGNASDKVLETIKKKFPKGIYMRNQSLNSMYNITDGAASEKAYKQWIKTYPESKMGKDVGYSYAAYTVALNYAREGNIAKACEYCSYMTDPLFAPTGYSAICQELTAKGNYEGAEQLFAKGLETANIAIESAPAQYRSQVELYFLSYGDVLYQLGKEEEALAMFGKVPTSRRGASYAMIQLKKGHPMAAFTLAESQLRNGSGNSNTENMLREAWEKANGNLEGCDEFVIALKAQRAAEKRREIGKAMISQPAPDFELKDIDGKTVRLSDLKGKVVVVDFWATWCGPCKRSLPAMKKTVEKYENDKDVVFLFIHTWEHGTPEEARNDAKSYFEKNGFEKLYLVMDTKDAETKTNKAVTAYGVTGIPAKFVIDGEGNTRFKISGFSGSDEEAVDELSQMIELCKRPRRQ